MLEYTNYILIRLAESHEQERKVCQCGSTCWDGDDFLLSCACNLVFLIILSEVVFSCLWQCEVVVLAGRKWVSWGALSPQRPS